MRRYLTTAIDYPNAPPHMGHVLEKVLADACARWWRLRGDAVRFQIGTDEHGSKIQRAAGREGIPPQEFVDRRVQLFVDLYERLCISHDAFVRTTDRERHWPTVVALWERLRAAGVLEKRPYNGLYCSGCEKFLTEKDLVEGKCPDHAARPERVEEENWFFLLSQEQAWLQGVLGQGIRIVPEFRARETVALLERGLEDVSFSRPQSSVSWGIPVPGDPTQTMYVWCDALANYISGLGYFTSREAKEWWEGAEDVTHVIGKDIARFHALIWPAMLKHARLPVPPPHHLLIHGFLTSEGQKMSKSIGNVVDPLEVIGKYGVDALRFYLLHEIPVGNDGDFSWKRFAELYDAKLRNQLGNLLHRVLTLFWKDDGAIVVPGGGGMGCAEVVQTWEAVAHAMEQWEVHRALQAAMKLVDAMNVWMNEVQPWALRGQERAQALGSFAERLRHVALLLLPFVPVTAQTISLQLGVPYAGGILEREFVCTEEMKRWGGCKGWKMVGEPKILFPKVD